MSNEENIMPEVSNSKRGATQLTIALVVLLVISSALAIYYYRQYSRIKADPNVVAKDELASLVAQIGKLMVLPKDETPSFVTVADPKALGAQEFFKNSKVGDKLVIYQGIRKAILFRPSENKIIEVAPISYTDTQNQQSTNPTQAPTQGNTTATTTKK